MKQIWKEDELIEHFTLSSDELKHLKYKTPAGRIGFSVQIKFMQNQGRFPAKLSDIPRSVIRHIAHQLEVSPDEINHFKWQGREAKQQRAKIRALYGFKKWSGGYSKKISDWLQTDVLSDHVHMDHLKEMVFEYLKKRRIEPPGKTTLERLCRIHV
jgi:hypothetical protein